MAQIAEHYEEVDVLLRSSLPSTIATSFKPPPHGSYTRLLEGSADEVHHLHHHRESLTGYPGSPGWGRRTLSLDLLQEADMNEEEEELLPDSAARTATRDKLARLALNGTSISNSPRKLEVLMVFPTLQSISP